MTLAGGSGSSRGARVMLAVMCALLVGCGDPNEVCAGVGSRGFTLTVVDAANRRNLNAEATVTVVNLGHPRDTLATRPDDAGWLATSAGVYTLKVSAPSYVTSFDTVHVTEEYRRGCPLPLHTRPVEIALHRAP